MKIDNCPVKLDEFKNHLRIETDAMNSELQILLLAAAEYIENFTMVNLVEDFSSDDFPFALRAAILMTAGRLFDSPNDQVFSLPTAAMNLANPYKRWDRIRK